MAGQVDKSIDFKVFLETEDTLDYLGRARKFSGYRVQENLNHSFAAFMADKGLNCDGYRMTRPVRETGLRSIAKYNRKQPEFDMEAFILSGEWTKKHFGPYMQGSWMLDWDDVIPLADRTTSAGFPHSKLFPNKGAFIDSGIREMLDGFWDDLASDDRKMRPIFTCSQKRELREVEKLAQGKIRTFTAAPTEHSLALNRFCFEMNYRFYESNNKTWSFVGASKYLLGWDTLYRRLDRFKKAFECDETDYDASLSVMLLEGQRDIRWDFLDRKYRTYENRKRFWNLYDDIIHSVIVLENGELIRKHTGNPSGCANTIVDNTMILFRLLAYAWIIRCREIGRQAEYNDFMANVEGALNGDDNTFTVSDEAAEWYNPVELARIWGGIGIKTKVPSEAAWKPRKLEECQFLSQSFVRHGDYWLPSPDSDRIYASLKWGSGEGDIRWHFLRACALRNDSWANIPVRNTIEDYLNYLIRYHANELVGTINDIPMQQIFNLYKSNDELFALYHGLEAAGAG